MNFVPSNKRTKSQLKKTSRLKVSTEKRLFILKITQTYEQTLSKRAATYYMFILRRNSMIARNQF
jgi:hypothetical protein